MLPLDVIIQRRNACMLGATTHRRIEELWHSTLKELTKRAKEYVELEADTKVLRVTFAERFTLFGNEDVVLSVTTTDKDDPNWWVVGGSTPMNLYSKSHFKSADEAFSFHTGIMMRMLDSRL